MTLCQSGVLVLLGVGVYYVQLRYAKANYPATLQWKLVLFAPAFLLGFSAAFLFGSQGLSLGRLLVFATLGIVPHFP